MGRTGNGVERRSSSIRIKFVHNGKTIKERLTLNGKSLEPTPANLKYANRVAEDIRRKLALGVFQFSEFFPDSPRALAEADEASTFEKLADLWLQSKGRLAEATRDQYATAVRFWKKLLGRETRVCDITHKLLAAKIGAYPWPSAKTHNNYLIALRGIFAMEYHGAASVNNPLIGLGNMPPVKTLPDPLEIQERDRILNDMKTHYDVRVYAYFLALFYSGTRPEELIALRWSDIDWKRKTARIQRVRTFRGSERDGSKTHTEREIDMTPQFIDALDLMKPYTHPHELERKGDPATASDIFQNPVTRRPWHDERSQRDHYWRPTLARLGIRWRKPYNTRHTFATVALMGGVNPGYVAAQLGHSTKMLHDKYSRWIPANDQGNARAMLAAAMEFVPNTSQKKTGSS